MKWHIQILFELLRNPEQKSTTSKCSQQMNQMVFVCDIVITLSSLVDQCYSLFSILEMLLSIITCDAIRINTIRCYRNQQKIRIGSFSIDSYFTVYSMGIILTFIRQEPFCKESFCMQKTLLTKQLINRICDINDQMVTKAVNSINKASSFILTQC